MADIFDQLEQGYAASLSGGGTDIFDSLEAGYQASAPQSTIPSIWEHPIDALTSSDWWLTRPKDNAPTPMSKSIAQMGLSALAPIGVGDEIVAGGAAGLDALLRGENYSNAYDQRLEQARQLQSSAPTAMKVALGLATGLKMPFPGYAKAGLWQFSRQPGLMNALANTAKMGTFGTALSEAQGFAAGEGGFQNRMDSAADAAPWGLAVGAGSQGLIEALQGTANLASKLFLNLPTKEQALGQAFKLRPIETERTLSTGVSPLEVLQQESKVGGLVSKPESNIFGSVKNSPFQETAKNLKGRMAEVGTKVDSILDGASPLTTAEILPGLDDFTSSIKGAAKNRAIESSLDAETANIMRLGLTKNLPPSEGKKIWESYQELVKLASKGDGDAIAMLEETNKQILSERWHPREIWQLRREWDKTPNWAPEAKDSAKDVYKTMRAGLQEKLLGTAGEKRPELESLFNEWERNFSIRRPVQNLARLEKLGKTQQAPVGQRLLATSIRAFLNKTLGLGFAPRTSPEMKLREAFGQTAPQRVLAGAAPNIAPVIAGLGNMASSDRQPLLPAAKSFISDAKESPQDFLDKKISKAESKMDNTEQPAFKPISMLADAMIMQESSGDPMAVSSKGARGLMQLMGPTAKEVASELGIEDYDIHDPVVNRKMGEYYIAKMLKLFKGDLPLALAAYNAGPSKVREWISQYGPTWEEISAALKSRGHYAETVHYVPTILRNYENLQKMA